LIGACAVEPLRTNINRASLEKRKKSTLKRSRKLGLFNSAVFWALLTMRIDN
jgi:hypothetical protein